MIVTEKQSKEWPQPKLNGIILRFSYHLDIWLEIESCLVHVGAVTTEALKVQSCKSTLYFALI